MVEYRFATEEQKELALDARRILEKELKPRLAELEAANDGRGEFPLDVVKTMAEAGYYAMDIPEEYGGLGFDNVTFLCTPAELQELTLGFLYNTNVIETAEDIRCMEISSDSVSVWLWKGVPVPEQTLLRTSGLGGMSLKGKRTCCGQCYVLDGAGENHVYRRSCAVWNFTEYHIFGGSRRFPGKLHGQSEKGAELSSGTGASGTPADRKLCRADR